MADEIQIVVSAEDNFSGVLGNFGEIMSGIRDTIDLVSEAFKGVVEFSSQFVEEASQSQTIMTQFDTVLQSTSATAGLTTETIGQLGNVALLGLQQQLDGANAKLKDMESTYPNLKNRTDEENLSIEVQREKIANLTNEIKQGTDGLTIYKDTTQLTRDQLIQLSYALEDTTIYSHDVTLAAETMMLRFQNINSSIFPESIQLSADLASSLGIDLTSAAHMVGMALDDPTMGIGRLNTQYRIFDASQMEVIKHMAATGDLAGAQAMIMDALSQRFGGAAKAVGETFAGQLDIAGNKINDLKEIIGDAFLPVLTSLLGQFNAFAEQPAVIGFFESLAKAISSALSGLPDAVKSLTDLFMIPSTSTPVFANIYEGGMTLATQISTDVQPAVFRSLDEIKTGIENRVVLWFNSVDWNAIAKGIDISLATAINSVQWNQAGAAFGKGIAGIANTNLSTNLQTPSSLQALGNGLTSFIAGAFGYVDWNSLSVDFWNGVKSIFTMHFSPPPNEHGLIGDWLVEEFNRSVLFVKDWWYNNISWRIQELGADLVNGISAGFSGSYTNLVNAASKFWGDFLNYVKAIFGVASPSTVFAEIGRNLILGLIAGVESMFGTLMNTITGIVGQLLQPFAPILQLLGIDINSLGSGSGTSGSGTGAGSLGGNSTTGNNSTGYSGTASQNVTNNFYGTVYIGMDATGALQYDCPSPNPLMQSGTGGLQFNTVGI